MTRAASSIQIRILGAEDAPLVTNVAPGIFDRTVDAKFTTEFLSDPRHHLVVALDGDQIVGFVSAVHYLHPDKPPELWINEVAVLPSHRRRGIASELLRCVLRLGVKLGCREAWVLTEPQNEAAISLYSSYAGGESQPRIMFTFHLQTRHRKR